MAKHPFPDCICINCLELETKNKHLKGLLAEAVGNLHYFRDTGPEHAGWQSSELLKLIADIKIMIKEK